ncbi:class A beta-lactamase [Desertihabitans aurantiacus]|uniref:class A beta-lactamase n=1 Tax=Desertihabitans aurantiacus TaxID=2282477 RepID=UPI0018E54881|nr:class A beta-lactamase [Desertihabitans aurantiacus]
MTTPAPSSPPLRAVLWAVVPAVLAATVACTPPPAPPPAPPATATTPAPAPASPPVDAGVAFAELEARWDARLGVFAVDTGSGRVVEHRADERFAYASTHKALSAAAVLEQTTDEELDRLVRFDADDLVEYSPVTEERLAEGMSLRELADAAVRYSDNTAGNLLLDELGGPAGFDAALEEVGDLVTQVDRLEPELNTAVPGDPRDTSTPRALATSLRAYAVEEALPAGDREVLNDWLQRNTTGDALVRAGVPGGWLVGDKTGTAGYGTRNDIAVVHPPGRAPLVLAVLSSRDEVDAEHDDALVAEATRVVVDALG